MRSRAWAVALAGLAGCATPAATLPAPSPIDLVADAFACTEAFLGVLANPDHARRFLPPGFEPADAARFLGSPVAAGRALVSVNAVSCEGSALEGRPVGSAEVIVVVNPPGDADASDAPGARHAYLVHHYTTGSRFLDATRGAGLAASAADVRAESTAGPAAGRATGRVSDAEGVLARFETTAVVVPPDTATALQHQVTPSGTLLVELAWRDSPTRAGIVTSCAMRPGSIVADVLGTTTCEDVEAFGVVVGPHDVAARVTFRPLSEKR